MMLVVFLQMQDLRSQLQEMIPEQQVCYWIPIYKSRKVEKLLWYQIPFTIHNTDNRNPFASRKSVQRSFLIPASR
jgi:hypothetical protein